MAWTEEQRQLARQRRQERRGQRYQSDLTDAEWDRVKPHIPPECRAGRHRSTDMREVVNAILYIDWAGCQWAALPREFPPSSTVYEYFAAWSFNGTFDRILFALVQEDRERSGREASPTLIIVDAQSVKSGPNRGGKGLMPSGYDGGKKVLGIKRHVAVDVCSNLLGVLVTAANVDDRAAAAMLLAMLRPLFPFVELVLGDAGYRGPNMEAAVAQSGTWRFEVEKRSDAASGFKPNRRWPVERTFAFIGFCRRLSRNYERYAHTAEAWFKLAMARILLRRTRSPRRRRPPRRAFPAHRQAGRTLPSPAGHCDPQEAWQRRQRQSVPHRRWSVARTDARRGQARGDQHDAETVAAHGKPVMPRIVPRGTTSCSCNKPPDETHHWFQQLCCVLS